MKFHIIFFFTFLLGACGSINTVETDFAYNESFSYSELEKLHRIQSGSDKGYQYESNELVRRHNKYWLPIAKKCRVMTESEGIKSFDFIFVVDKTGNVIAARSETNSEGVNCYLSGIKKIKYPTPPYENWYQIVGVK